MQKQLATGLTASTANDLRSSLRNNADILRFYETQAVKAQSATSRFTEQLVRQDLTLKQAVKSRKVFNETLREQLALQKMMAVQWSRSSMTGRVTADTFIQRGSSDAVNKLTSSFGANYKALRLAKKGSEDYAMAAEVMRMRVGMANQVLASGAQNMIKWGKNTQWAGRQLMVGFTVPLAIFAAVAGKAFYDLDKSITSIAKVYDTYATDAKGREMELAEVRKNSIQVAIDSAKRYGASIQDTLDVEQQLAAVGMRSQELYNNTAQIQKAATVGQMDYNKATQAAITLNTVFGMTSEQVGDSFAYMASVANATSLTMEDFSAALPRVGGTVKQLGGTLQDVGLLLTAMRSQGISAEQGANAIKSGAASMIKPTKSATELLLGMSHGIVNLNAISNRNGGNVVKNFEDLASSFQQAGFTAAQQQKALTAIFGKYQLNRINAVIEGLRQVNVEGTQMNRAFNLAAEGAGAWQQVFSNALDQSMNSASGKFKRAIESFKAEFATVGKNVLPAATALVSFGTKVAHAFNSMPKWTKYLAFFGAAALAIIGPIIMLSGLFANMIGQIFRVASAVVGLKYKFKAMEPEARIQEMLANQASVSWNNQADAARALSMQLGLLTERLHGVSQANQLAAMKVPAMLGNATPNYRTNLGGIGPALPPMNLKTNSKGRLYNPDTGRYASKGQLAAMGSLQNEAAASAVVAQNSAASARNWSIIGNKAMTLGVAAGFMGSMVAGGNKLVSYMSNALIFAGLVGPMVVKSIAGSKIAKTIGAAVTAGLGRVKLAGLTSGLAGAGGPLGASLAAVALGSLYIWRKTTSEIARARAEQEKIGQSAKDWADILGFEYIKVGQVRTATGEIKDTADGIAKKFAEANKPIAEMVKRLKEAGDEQGIINAAIAEGIKVRQSGGSASQAEAATATVLRVAGYKSDEVETLMKRIKLRLDFGNSVEVITAQMDEFNSQIEKIAQNKFKQGNWEKFKHASSGFGGWGDGTPAASNEAVNQLSQQFWNAWSQADMQGRKEYFDKFEKQFKTQQDAVFSRLSASTKQKLASAGVNSVGDLNNLMYRNAPKYNSLIEQVPKDERKSLLEQAEVEERVAKAVAEQNGLTDKQIANVHSLADLRQNLDQATMTVTEGEKAYADAIAESAHLLGGPLSEAYKLALLNGYRHNAGLGDATNSAQGFAVVINGVSTALDTNGVALNTSALALDDWKNGIKNAMSGATNFAVEVANSFKSIADNNATEAIQKSADAASEALDAAADKQEKKFDKRQDAIEAKYDKIAKDRSKGVKKQIDVEKAAEDQRKKIFEAEKQRLERMSNLQNMNIDFNMQMAQGNFDEAVKISNDITATQQGYDLEDANARAEAMAEARQKQLEDQEAKEDAALENKKKRELEALDAERERYRKEVEAQRRAIQQKAANDIEAKRLQQERASRTLELELATIRASVPRNKAEYDKQIAQIEAAYSRYGVNLKAQGDEWSKVIGVGLNQNIAAAAAGLQNDIDWKSIGANITEQLTGFTAEAFRQWIITGKMPTGPSSLAKTTTTTKTNPENYKPFHTGGSIDGSSGSRKGYSSSAAPMPGEQTILAQKGEFMMQKSAVEKFGTGFMDMINQGQFPGGFIAPIALTAGGILSSLYGAALMGSMASAGAGAGFSGDAGDVKLSKDQLSNAHRILTVGRRMGASRRDLQVALMTAMQESNLHNVNYGDRDSLGLFQQRPSQGWGSPAQVMNPEYAAGQFFRHLLAIKSRDKMSLTQEAQAVQRSAYPNAYAKWGPLAASILNIPGMKVGGSVRWDNTIANLHKGEKVLTAPLSQKLERGIDRIDQGYANEYNVTVDLRGAFIRDDVDIEKAVNKAIDKRESKFGRSRKIGADK